MKFGKILILLDGSPFAEAALPKAVELIRGNPDATLIPLRPVEASAFPGVDPIAMYERVPRSWRRRERPGPPSSP